jgi:hypothetical protein
MANRMFDEKDFTIQKRMCSLYGVFSMVGTTPTLQRWIYPKLGQGVVGSTVQTYQAAPITPAPIAAAGSYPTQYQRGCEGFGGATRTAQGLWTVTLQDNYQRIMSVHCHQSVAGGLSNIVGVGENSTITNMAAAGGSVIGLALLSATGTATDPTAGSLIYIMLRLHDATEP